MARNIAAHTPPESGPTALRCAPRHGRSTRLAVALALLALSLLLSGIASAHPAVPTSPRGGIGGPDCNKASENCLPVNPGYGSTGTVVTVGIQKLPPGKITIGYGQKDCSNPTTITTGTVSSKGTATITFPWPATGAGDFVICITDSSGHTFRAPTGFKVLSPAVAVTPDPAQSQQQVTVNGTGFLPTASTSPVSSSVDVFSAPAGSGGAAACANKIGTVDAGA